MDRSGWGPSSDCLMSVFLFSASSLAILFCISFVQANKSKQWSIDADTVNIYAVLLIYCYMIKIIMLYSF